MWFERVLTISEYVRSEVGQFANLMTIPTAADSLAGRMEVIRLLPLLQAELFSKKSDFIDTAFASKKPSTEERIDKCAIKLKCSIFLEL